MDLALVGLGRMGLNMALRLLRGGHRVVVHNRSRGPVDLAVERGAEAAPALSDVAAMLEAPRVVWLMLPSGGVTTAHVEEALGVLEAGDVLVDGANGRWTEALEHAARARERGVRFVDVGVSGGVWGLDSGYSLMAGGDADAVALLEPAFATLAPAPDAGWGRVGPVGAGHFVKMVHNGVEYGMMESLAEGFAILEAQTGWGLDGDGEPVEAPLDLGAIAGVWRTGSVVQSWLLDLAAEVLEGEDWARTMGVDFEPLAFHCTRGWIHSGVRVPLHDEDDPTSAWVASSRRPGDLALALRSARAPR